MPQDTLPPGLYLVGTPIGNLEDITLRALRVLRGVDRVLCEDTRETAHLLSHYDVHAPMQSCDEHKEHTCAEDAVTRIRAGERLALVTDAGLPGISDPGAAVAAAVAAAGLPVVPIPGANAALTALVGSGMIAQRFLFNGFLPSKGGARRTELERLRAMVTAGAEPLTLVFYEAPHRILEMLEDVAAVWGADCKVVIGRELTKLHEEFLRGKLGQLAESLAERPARGEITLVVGPPEPSAVSGQADSAQSLSDRVEELIRQAKLDRKEALKLAAKERGLTRRAAYDQLVESKGKPN